MREQIIALTEKEYPFMKGWFEKRFVAMHESDYQKGRNQLVVALDENKKVVATISYIHWPVVFSGKLLNSYQMVGLLVDPNVRGAGLFGKVLRKLDELLAQTNADAVMGFPVPLSKPGFEKQGWKNITDLDWFLKPVSMLAAIKKREFTGKGFISGPPTKMNTDGFLQTAGEAEFWKFREALSPEWKTWHQQYEIDDITISIIFRIQKRWGLNEAVIGKIFSGDASQDQIISALKKWNRDLRREGSVAMSSIAVNTKCDSAIYKATKSYFWSTGKKIHYIVKSYSQHASVQEPSQWNLMRADMETW